ncbi:hypothetical protein ACFQ2B_22265 [Streptomyces stramineus]
MIIASAQFTARPCDVAGNAARMAGLVTEAGGAPRSSSSPSWPSPATSSPP